MSENKIVINKDNIKNMSSNMMWNLKTTPPLSERQFILVENIIKSLVPFNFSFFIIDFEKEFYNINYIQTAIVGDDNHYTIEIQFNKPCIFTYKENGKTKAFCQEFTQYAFDTYDVKEVVEIFRQLLCKKQIPNMKNWKNITKKLFVERL